MKKSTVNFFSIFAEGAKHYFQQSGGPGQKNTPLQPLKSHISYVRQENSHGRLQRASVASPRLCRHSVGRSTRSKIRNEKIARKIKLGKMSSSEALKWLNWIPLAVRRLSHRYIAVENAIKGNIPQHFESFKSTLRSSHGYNTTNGYLPRLPKPKTECGRRVSYFRSIIFFTVLFNNLRKPMSCANFKKNLTRFLMDKHF